VNASGTAQVVRDQAKIDELWHDGLKAWFPNGKDDPNISLLKIKMHQAEYWDRAGGRMATLFQQVKAALTGQPDSNQRNEKLGDEPQ
jgi:general stress protein 26